jgi:hypothetical protein
LCLNNGGHDSVSFSACFNQTGKSWMNLNLLIQLIFFQQASHQFSFSCNLIFDQALASKVQKLAFLLQTF